MLFWPKNVEEDPGTKKYIFWGNREKVLHIFPETFIVTDPYRIKTF